MIYRENISELAKSIRLLVLDVDGVLTDGRLFYSETGEAIKVFDSQDGLGIQLLQASGVACAIMTARQSAMVASRASELGVMYTIQDSKNKKRQLEKLAIELKLNQREIAYVGDDLPDLAAMRWCGLPIAVANAHAAIQDVAVWHLKSNGGFGAVREISDGLIIMQGKDPIRIFENLRGA